MTLSTDRPNQTLQPTPSRAARYFLTTWKEEGASIRSISMIV
jgi:hypothetical protein